MMGVVMEDEAGGERADESDWGDLAGVYRRHYAAMVRLAALLLDYDHAEDVVQDCFVALHHHWGHVDSPRPYLRSSVVNRCRAEQRRRRLARRVPASEPQPPSEPEVLSDALAALPFRQRAALVLRFYEDLDENTIAGLLHVRPATVRSLIHR